MKGNKISLVLLVLSVTLVLTSIFLVVGNVFFEMKITGRAAGDAGDGGGGGSSTPSGEESGGGGGGSSQVLYDVSSGKSFETPDFTVDVFGSSKISVSDARY